MNLFERPLLSLIFHSRARVLGSCNAAGEPLANARRASRSAADLRGFSEVSAPLSHMLSVKVDFVVLSAAIAALTWLEDMRTH